MKKLIALIFASIVSTLANAQYNYAVPLAPAPVYCPYEAVICYNQNHYFYGPEVGVVLPFMALAWGYGGWGYYHSYPNQYYWGDYTGYWGGYGHHGYRGGYYGHPSRHSGRPYSNNNHNYYNGGNHNWHSNRGGNHNNNGGHNGRPNGGQRGNGQNGGQQRGGR